VGTAAARDTGDDDDGVLHLMMPVANNGKGFAMLQPDQGIKSLVIEIGLLRSPIMKPKPEQFIIGVEASIKSLCTEGFNLSGQRTAFLSVAMGSHVGMTDWYDQYLYGPTKLVTSVTVAPVVSLHTLITNVPTSMPIALLKIDTQAHNYHHIIAGAGELIKRVAVIFSECIVNIAHHGAADERADASLYGDENDSCLNIRMYLEAKGFTFMGITADNYESATRKMDIMFAQPKYAAAMKPCFTKNAREFGDPRAPMMPKRKALGCFHEKITTIVHAGLGGNLININRPT